MLSFDGSENTLPYNDGKDAKDVKLQTAIELLHQFLLVNNSLRTKNDSENQMHCSDAGGKVNVSKYPFLNKVEKLWPELKTIYIAVMDCLRKAQIFENNFGKEIKEEDKNSKSISKSTILPASSASNQNKESIKVQYEEENGITAIDNTPLSKVALVNDNCIAKPTNEKPSNAIKPAITKTDGNFSTLQDRISHNELNKDGIHVNQQHSGSTSVPKPSSRPPAPVSDAPSRPKLVSRTPPLPPTPISKTVLLPISANASPRQYTAAVPTKTFSKVPPPRPKPPVFNAKNAVTIL